MSLFNDIDSIKSLNNNKDLQFHVFMKMGCIDCLIVLNARSFLMQCDHLNEINDKY